MPSEGEEGKDRGYREGRPELLWLLLSLFPDRCARRCFTVRRIPVGRLVMASVAAERDAVGEALQAADAPPPLSTRPSFSSSMTFGEEKRLAVFVTVG